MSEFFSEAASAIGISLIILFAFVVILNIAKMIYAVIDQFK